MSMNEETKKTLDYFFGGVAVVCTLLAIWAAFDKRTPFSDWSMTQGGAVLAVVWFAALTWIMFGGKKEEAESVAPQANEEVKTV